MSAWHPDRKNPLILLVDDSKTVRRMGRDALESVGLDVVEAGDGRQAVRAFSNHQPDLVLLDIKMPKLDGFDVCEEIRRTSAGAHVPVMMVTSCDDLDSIRRAYEVGATDFATKPLNWLIISQRIRYMLRMRVVLDELRTSQERLALAQRTARLGSWELDLRTGTVIFSDELGRLYGLPSGPREIEFKSLLNQIDCEDRVLVRTAAERSLREGIPLNVDHRLTLRKGEERSIHVQAEVSYDERGRPHRLSGTAQDVTDRKRTEDEVRFLAYHDSLTRLGNRRLFTERLGYALAHARRHRAIVGVLFLDLDHFKRINDTLGHSTGDRFLQRVAQRLKNCVRECDFVSRATLAESGPTVSRFGGDEFMVSLCSVESREGAGLVAERILETLARPVDLDGHTVVISASIGIAVSPSDGDDIDSLLRNADAAMHHAKQQGRGSYQFYEPSMNAVADKNLELESDLREALKQGDLLLHYQPKIELRSGRVTAFEALVRWRHPELGMVPPNRFVPLAEQAGLIVSLGEFVLKAACEQARKWRQAGLPPVRMAVNLSAHQFRTDQIAETVARIVAETPISPRQLDIEITESAMMHNKAITVDVLRRLKGTGVTVSLDDFGTGYSSLSYLKGFPVDTVKIDRSFIRDMTTDPDDAALTAAIISMAKALNLKVVAEGVETEEQLEFLQRHGCDEAQGYLFSRPLPGDEATEFLRRCAEQGTPGFAPRDAD
ncbi:MAG: EAL domain-containing protein [Myxococcota bacterium]